MYLLYGAFMSLLYHYFFWFKRLEVPNLTRFVLENLSIDFFPVCDSFRATHVIWMVMLLSAIATMLFLGIAVWMGWIYRKRLALQNIKYTSGAVH